MKTLLRRTTAYRMIAEDGAHATLVLFPDEAYLRDLLRECAKAFFHAEEGTRTQKLLDGESFSDCVMLPAAGAKLTVDDAARVIDGSALRPVEGSRKLFVVDGFQNASPLVQNKLLKVLEEPPAGVFFLLGATAEHAVLPTVLSRVRRISVPPFSEEEIYSALVRGYGLKEGVKEAAAASGGIYSVAESLLAGGGEEFRLAERFLAFENIEALCRTLGEKKEKRAFLSALRLMLRDMLFYATGQEKFAALTGGKVKALAREYPKGALIAAQGLVSNAEREIQFNANLGQCALNLAMKIEEEITKWQKLS